MTRKKLQKVQFTKLRRKMKKHASAQETLTTDLDYKGLVSQSGKPHVRFSRENPVGDADIDETPVLIPLHLFHKPSEVIKILEANNFLLPYDNMRSTVLKNAASIRNFRRTILNERPGFDANSYVFGNGEYISVPSDDDQPPHYRENTFPTDDRRNRRRGTIADFNAGLERLMSDQDVLVFCICVALTPFLLPFSQVDANFGFQIVGGGSIGKTTAIRLAGSILGEPSESGEILNADYLRYVGRDRIMQSNDNLLIITDLDRWFALETPRQKLDLVRTLDGVFDYQEEPQPGCAPFATNLLLLTKSRLPVEDLCGDAEAARTRLRGRLLTIPIDSSRPYGVISKLPEGVETPVEMINEIRTLIISHFGHTANYFITRLLRKEAKDEGYIRERVTRTINRFVSLTGVDMNRGEEVLTAFRFAAVYATGKIAQACGALPSTLPIEAAVLSCYRLHKGVHPPASFLERLKLALRGPNIVDLGSDKELPLVDDGAYASALAFVRYRKNKTQVYVRPENLHQLFKDASALERQADFIAMREVETVKRNGTVEHNFKVKRRLGAGRKQERVHCFNLPPRSTADE